MILTTSCVGSPTTPEVHTVRTPKAFKKEFQKKSKQQQDRILGCVRKLRVDVHASGLHVHKIQGQQGVWQAYVDGANRLTFHWDGPVIVLRHNCNHDFPSRNP